jgi:hypothetical protein
MKTQPKFGLRLILNLAGLLIIFACANPLTGAGNGQVKVKGTYEYHSDITTNDATSGFAHTKIDMARHSPPLPSRITRWLELRM